jgi:hypothetical protein
VASQLDTVSRTPSTGAVTRAQARVPLRTSARSAHTPGDDLAIALDPATSKIHKGDAYVLELARESRI